MFRSHAVGVAVLVVFGGVPMAAAEPAPALAEESGRTAGAPASASGRSAEALPELRADRLEPGQTPRGALAAAAAASNPPTYLGDNKWKCVYRIANSWSYSWDGADASWEQAEDESYNHFGAMDLRNTGWVGGTSKADYTAEIGEGRKLLGDGWRRLKVRYPWRYSGDVDLLSEFSAVPVGGGFSSASISMGFYVDLARDDSHAKLVVDSFSVVADRGVPGDFDDVSNDGIAHRTVSLTGHGEKVHARFGVDAHLSTTTQSMTNARSAFDFRDDDGHGWKTGRTHKWIYTLKPSHYLSDCGEG